MPMSDVYGTPDVAEAQATLESAIDLGVTFWDTAEIYGAGGNEELIGPVLERHRDAVVIATKFGFAPDGSVAGRPENARAAIDGSLRRLRTDHVDLWYLHRVDPTVPIEETVGAMAEAVAAGKVRHLGLSEASAEIAAPGDLPCTPSRRCRANGRCGRATSSPRCCRWPASWASGSSRTARSAVGLFTGKLTDLDDLGGSDYRRGGPRFSPENFEHNRALVTAVEEYAAGVGCTPGQLAIAWVLAQGDDVVPIPGTKRRTYLAENAAAVDVVADARAGAGGRLPDERRRGCALRQGARATATAPACRPGRLAPHGTHQRWPVLHHGGMGARASIAAAAVACVVVLGSAGCCLVDRAG